LILSNESAFRAYFTARFLKIAQSHQLLGLINRAVTPVTRTYVSHFSDISRIKWAPILRIFPSITPTHTFFLQALPSEHRSTDFSSSHSFQLAMSYYPAHLAETPGFSKCRHLPGSSCRCSAEVRQRDALLSANALAGQRNLPTQDVYRPNTVAHGSVTDVYGGCRSGAPTTNVQVNQGQMPGPYPPWQYPQYNNNQVSASETHCSQQAQHPQRSYYHSYVQYPQPPS
jgi:hypothetical protein